MGWGLLVSLDKTRRYVATSVFRSLIFIELGAFIFTFYASYVTAMGNQSVYTNNLSLPHIKHE